MKKGSSLNNVFNFKILVVEDEKIAQIVIKKILQSLNLAVDIANNGSEAITLFKENQYSFVFMDLGLPDMTGFDVTEFLKIEMREKSSIPFIALTAHDEKEFREKAFAVGMNDFIVKPLTLEKAKKTLIQHNII
jgi:CheY-like chemotaxis protein